MHEDIGSAGPMRKRNYFEAPPFGAGAFYCRFEPVPRELALDLTPIDRFQSLRDHFWQALREQFGNRVPFNGHPTHRLPNTLNVSFVGRIGAEILARLDGVAASTGSACHAGSIELSPVLEAMSVAPEMGMGAVRFSLGRGTTRDEINAVVERLTETLGTTG